MKGRFAFSKTALSGLTVVHRKPIEDDRGSLTRFYCAEEYKTAGVFTTVLQINHTLTKKSGAVRGLHFQFPPNAETKAVSCLKGEIYDVAVDLRQDSPTFLDWHSEILSGENQKSLIIPEGFAHGFQTLVENCELLYLHSALFCSDSEGALNVRDPRIGIDWPLPITELSERDRSHPFIAYDFNGMLL